MRAYFEYPLNDQIKQRVLAYYNGKHNSGSSREDMHGANHELKIKLKLERLERHVAICPDQMILDVGCSEGALETLLAPRCKQITAIDISPSLIQSNQNRINLPNVSFEAFDGEHISNKSLYDLVVMFDVLEHAFEPDMLLESVSSALKPGGLLAIQVPTTGWLSELLFGKYHMGHLRYYDDVYLQRYLTRFGFKVLNCDVYNSVPFSSRLLTHPGLYRTLDAFCRMVKPPFFPYYGSVFAIGRKEENQ